MWGVGDSNVDGRRGKCMRSNGRREECSWDIFNELVRVCQKASKLYCVPKRVFDPLSTLGPGMEGMIGM